MSLCSSVCLFLSFVLSKTRKLTRNLKRCPQLYANARKKVAIYNMYLIALIITSINGYTWSAPLGPNFSLILNNIFDQHWSENWIKWHHTGAYELIFEYLHKSNFTVQIFSIPIWCHNYLLFSSSPTSLVA